MTEFSIIIPVYNTRPYLQECIDSILEAGSRIGIFEIIAVNDGSTDGSGDILDRYAATNLNIKVLHVPHRGVGAARNAGLGIAVGKYVAFVDSDDVVANDFMSHLIDSFNATKSDLIHYHFEFFEKEFCCQGGRTEECRVISHGREKAIWAMHALFDVGYSCLCAFRRERAYIKWPEDMRMYEDVVWALRLIASSKIVCDDAYSGYGYRRHANSTTACRASIADVIRYMARTYVDLRKLCNGHPVRFIDRLPVYRAYCRRIRHWMG